MAFSSGCARVVMSLDVRTQQLFDTQHVVLRGRGQLLDGLALGGGVVFPARHLHDRLSERYQLDDMPSNFLPVCQ